MKYSFISPRKKSALDNMTKLWLIFISGSFSVLLLFSVFVGLKISSFKDSTEQNNIVRKRVETEIDNIENKIAFIKKQKTSAEEIFASNTILKDSIKNLFDLVPDQITLSKVIMDKDSLIIYGVTPSKDTYNFLLASPLRSIFHTSSTVFYLTDEGWYRFVSTNKIEDGDEQI